MSETTTRMVRKVLRNILETSKESSEMTAAFVSFVITKHLVVEAGEYLVYLAETAYRLRRWAELGKVASLLTSLPSETYQSKGRFFQAYSISHLSNTTTPHAIKLMEEVFERGPEDFRGRSLLALGAFHCYRQEFTLAEEFYRQAFTVANEARDPITSALAMKMLGVLASIHGSPREAMRIYESLLADGSLQATRPDIYTDLANSYAYDLAQVGRVYDAHRIAIDLARTPYGRIFTEVGQTLAEIEQQLPAARIRRPPINTPLIFTGYRRKQPDDIDERLGPTFREAPGLVSIEEQHNLLMVWLLTFEPKKITGRSYQTLSAMYQAYLRHNPTAA